MKATKSPTEPWHGNTALFPDLYDLLYEDYSEDIDLYKDLTSGCETVLECGVGTGRIALPLARAGHIVYGIDNSSQMLATLKAKRRAEPPEVQRRLRCMEADMCSFDLGVAVDAALIPFMTFNFLRTLQDQTNCLQSIHRHLRNHGRLTLELMSMYPEWFHDDGIARLVLRKHDTASNETVEMSRVTRFDPSSQVLEHDRHYRFIDSQGHAVRERTTYWRNRFFFLGEATLLLEKAGFRILDVWGDRKRGPYTKASQVMILQAEKIGSNRHRGAHER